MAFLWKTDWSKKTIDKSGSEGGEGNKAKKNYVEETAWWQFRGNSKGNEFEGI